MQIKKNDIYDVTITGITSEGSGVAKIDGFAVFIPQVAVNDFLKVKIVKVLKNYAFGIVEEIITPSVDRQESDCDVFQKCGGCCYRHINYEAELKIKEKMVEDCFNRIGNIDVPTNPIVGSERVNEYRNKAQFPIGLDENGRAISGFYANRSHRIIECMDCKLQPKIFNEILVEVLNFINENKISVYDEITHDGLIRHLYIRQAENTQEIMVCIVATKPDFKLSEKFAKILCEKFPQITTIIINHNPKKTNVILGEKCKVIYGDGYITDVMCGVEVKISPLAFYQINKLQAQRLYKKAIEFADVNKDDILLDLYCGIGTIGLSAARQIKKLIGVEVIPQAIDDAKINARINGFDNAEFICGDCKDAVEKFEKMKVKPTTIIVDPPRKGCDLQVIETIARLSPRNIVMVSCNPSTAARDCSLLEQKGYKVIKYTPFDLFPRSKHVECVVLLSHKNS